MRETRTGLVLLSNRSAHVPPLQSDATTQRPRHLSHMNSPQTVTGSGPIVVFDTDCVLCSGMVAFILAHERAPTLRFVGAWSAEGLALATTHGFSRADLDDTFLVVRDGLALTRSDAGIQIMQHLRAPWRWGAVVAIVPRPMRDALYGFIARRRYRWFGRRDSCTVVPPGERHRFIGVTGPSGARNR